MGFTTLTTAFATDIVSDRVAPPFLQGPNGSKYLTVIGRSLDTVRYRSAQAMLVHMPGLGDASGLYYIGLDRLLAQGPNEPNSTFIPRLSGAFDLWQYAGTDWAVLEEALAYLAPSKPVAKIVSNTSVWSYYAANATPATHPPMHLRWQGPDMAHRFNWNWDNDQFDPHVVNGRSWWREWLIIDADLTPVGNGITAITNAFPTAITTSAAYGLTTGQNVWLDEIHGALSINGGPYLVTVTGANSFTIPVNSILGAHYTSGGVVYLAGPNNWVGPSQVVGNFTVGSAYTVGLSCPSSWITALRSIVGTFKAAHCWMRYLVISFDSGLYQPDIFAGGGVNPDGTFGPWASPQSGVYTCLRFDHSRYADGAI